MKNKRQGFTLIELLAVIVILGLLMAIAIPSVTKYITQSRKKTLTTTIGNYTSALVSDVNNMEYIFTATNTIYAVPIECIALERGGSNPFGEWMQASSSYWAYVLVQYDDKTSSYTYGFTFKDSAGYGLYPITIDKLNTNGNQIKTSLNLERPTTGLISNFVSKDIWKDSGFNIDDETRMKVIFSRLENQIGDGKSTCTLAQKGSNYTEIEKERNKTGTLKNSGNSYDLVFGKELKREKIEEIYTKDYIDIPNNVIDSWDASYQQNESIMAWILDEDNNDMYELYIGQEGGVKATGNVSLMFAQYTKSKVMDLSNLYIKGATQMSHMFNGDSLVTKLDLRNFDTSEVTTMEWMFNGMSSLTSINVSSFDTSKVKSMYAMFESCSSLKNLNLSNFNTSNVTDMGMMFSGTSSLTTLNLSSFDTSKVTSMYYMFNGNSSLTSLNISSFNTTNVTNMYGMFMGCSKIKSLDLNHFDTSNVTTMNRMFNNMNSLTTLKIDNFNTKNVTNMQIMFGYCYELETLDLSHFDTSSLTSASQLMTRCKSLSYLDIRTFDYSVLGNHDSFVSVSKTIKIIAKDEATKNWINDKGYTNVVVFSEL